MTAPSTRSKPTSWRADHRHQQRRPRSTRSVSADRLRHVARRAARHSVCETSTGEPVPAATIRRLCCDDEIIPVVLDGDGVTLDVGRVKRSPPACSVGRCGRCTAPVRTPAAPSASTTATSTTSTRGRDLGSTDLANLVPLCSRHHHLVHEGGWTLILRADRTTAWCRPDGTIHFDGSTVDVAPSGVASDDQEPSDYDERRLELLNDLNQTPEEIRSATPLTSPGCARRTPSRGR